MTGCMHAKYAALRVFPLSSAQYEHSSERSMNASAPKSGGQVDAERIADLAAASRILAAQGVVDGFGHVSMRHPRAHDRYLMARAVAPALVTPEDVIEYDLGSNPCNANGRS